MQIANDVDHTASNAGNVNVVNDNVDGNVNVVDDTDNNVRSGALRPLVYQFVDQMFILSPLPRYLLGDTWLTVIYMLLELPVHVLGIFHRT